MGPRPRSNYLGALHSGYHHLWYRCIPRLLVKAFRRQCAGHPPVVRQYPVQYPVSRQEKSVQLGDSRRRHRKKGEPMGLCATIGEILIFGAIHIGGWNFHFASFAEQLIWRVASVSCTAIPPLVFLAVFYMGQLKRKRLLVVALVVGGGTVSYIVCRLCMFVEMFTSLRAVPASVYQTPQWSQYFPAFG
jgi:hypothetical protein